MTNKSISELEKKRTHSLIISGVHFNFMAVVDGDRKTAFVKDDRDYKSGDFLALNEIDNDGNFTGSLMAARITDVAAIDKNLYPQIAGEFVFLSFELVSVNYL
ncbi:hypothetical protein XBJ2_440062 [Xenorhabdus bovienii str. Jollieti]|uniref:DUF3850 domain-containing protein n=1 Tax=Xenorhabdus bovienii (strain SS-2004) TaxID=406818 RepID=D3UZP9_XENBS|nr:DUF3850 domain-containing protein [Xenorhabdus bovienii]CBJ80132.1 hypothetical protein XBJ1_0991 [Xenorhabdus bovienii SS-2004]CDH29845.1 hypothetical protein XBJ2_440062 [Xenorhabdus bovienii str. Jollieti]